MNDSLTERWRKANVEYEEIKQWAVKETQKIWDRMEREGTPIGLDTNHEAYMLIRDEYKRRTLALFDKHGLPNKPDL